MPSEPGNTEEQYAATCHSEVSRPSEFMPEQTLLLAVNVPSGNAAWKPAACGLFGSGATNGTWSQSG